MRTRARALEISPALLAEVEAHARQAYPEECCGVLIGSLVESSSAAARVDGVWSTPNAEPAHRSKGYVIAPEELLEAHKDARSRRQEVIGYYHSHPDQSAVPSARDLIAAAPGVSYLIVSLDHRGVRERRSWRLQSDRQCFAEEQIV